MRKPPDGGVEPPVFFLDRNLGRGEVAAALRAAGAVIEEHDQHFAQDAQDADWLPEVGRRGWVIITRDDRIRYRDVEREAALSAGVALFIFTGKKMRGAEIGAALAKALPKMTRLLRKQQRPFMARVARGGEVAVIDR